MAPMIGRCSGPHQQRHHLSIVLRTSQSNISATFDELPFEMNADSASAGALQVRETADCRHAGLAKRARCPDRRRRADLAAAARPRWGKPAEQRHQILRTEVLSILPKARAGLARSSCLAGQALEHHAGKLLTAVASRPSWSHNGLPRLGNPGRHGCAVPSSTTECYPVG